MKDKIKHSLLLAIGLLCLTMCNAKLDRESRNAVEPTFQQLGIDNRLDSLLGLFISENNAEELEYWLEVLNSSFNPTTELVLWTQKPSTDNAYPLFYLQHGEHKIHIRQNIDSYVSCSNAPRVGRLEKYWKISLEKYSRILPSRYVHVSKYISSDDDEPLKTYAIHDLNLVSLDINNSLHINPSAKLYIDNRLDSLMTGFVEQHADSFYNYRLFVSRKEAEYEGPVDPDFLRKLNAGIPMTFPKVDSMYYDRFIIKNIDEDTSQYESMAESLPLFYLNYKGQRVFVYTGLEGHFDTDFARLETIDESKHFPIYTWCIELQDSLMRISKEEQPIPDSEWKELGINWQATQQKGWVDFNTQRK